MTDIQVCIDINDHKYGDHVCSRVSIDRDPDSQFPVLELGDQLAFALNKSDAPRKELALAYAIVTLADLGDLPCCDEHIEEAIELLLAGAMNLIEAWETHDEGVCC